MGRTTLRVASAVSEPGNSTFYPFFLHSIYSGQIPPFSRFFYAVHYVLHVLRIHPNSAPALVHLRLLLRGVFVGVMPSIAMLRHFFYLGLTSHQLAGCVRFVAARGSNAISRAGKKVEDVRNKWVFMDAKCSHDLLELPTELTTSEKGWSSDKITDPQLRPLMRKMEADLKVEKLTGAMIINEFLTQRLAPL